MNGLGMKPKVLAVFRNRLDSYMLKHIRAVNTIAMFMGWQPWQVVYGFKRTKK